MRNLKYLIAICAISLSACSTSQKLASTPDADDDDVYFTQAKAGDEIIYADDSYQANGYNDGYDDDEYYYYGDYASRINRFNNFSPFGYNSFYYGYSPFNSWRWNMGYGMGGWNRGFGFNYGLGWGYDPFLYGGMYSPYFYDPFYASFYGYGWGLGYGFGYSPWGLGYPGIGGYGWGWGGGGFLVGGSRRQNPRPVYAGGTAATSARPGRTTVYETSPGRRPGDLSTQSIYTTGGQSRAIRDTRTRDGQTTRPVIQQVDRRPTYNPAPAPSPSFGGGGGGGGNSGGGGGGGGRPVRP